MLAKNGREAWKKRKRAEERVESQRVRKLRAVLMDRCGGRCQCCGIRRAESMHEEPPRSIGTIPGPRTSMMLCGSGTTGCHGFVQRDQISATAIGDGEFAAWRFEALTVRASRWIAGEDVGR